MAEMLSAADVAAMQRYSDSTLLMVNDTLRDVAALVAQDARWRALVGDLLVYLRHKPDCLLRCYPCLCGADTLRAQAQAALDGADNAPA